MSKTKPLFWDKAPPDALSKSVWQLKGLAHAALSAPLPEASRVFLESKFPKNAVTAPKVAPPRTEAVCVLDRTREQNVGIVLSYLRLPLHDIRRALLTMDARKLSVDTRAALQSILPTAADLTAVAPYRDSVEAQTGGLSLAVRFYLLTATIPRIGNRIECWLLLDTYTATASQIRTDLRVLRSAADALRNSPSWEQILQLVLRVGNFMNHGTRHGDCGGFRLANLEKLAACRTSDQQSTLLEAVVGMALTQYGDDSLRFVEELVVVRQACVIDIADLRQTVGTLANRMSTLAKELSLREMAQSNSASSPPSSSSSSSSPSPSFSNEDVPDLFASRMGAFHTATKGDMEALQSELGQTERLLQLLGEYYAEEPNEFVATAFFQNVTSFCLQVDTLRKKRSGERSNPLSTPNV